MTRLMTIIGAALAVSAQAQVIDKNDNPGTLFPKDYQNFLLDRTARRVGDIITILIDETSAASLTANTTLSKSDSNKVGLKTFVDFFDRLLKPIESSSSSSNSGKGSTDQTAKFSAKITGVVKEVRPNGVLVFEANKSMLINKELQTLKLTGMIRRDDITPENTVKSERVADAELNISGQGGIADRQRRGILTRILDWLF